GIQCSLSNQLDPVRLRAWSALYQRINHGEAYGRNRIAGLIQNRCADTANLLPPLAFIEGNSRFPDFQQLTAQYSLAGNRAVRALLQLQRLHNLALLRFGQQRKYGLPDRRAVQRFKLADVVAD